ncbi:MAG: sulfotransferase domain-containing protein [Candidatus Poribacteria bacterium]
MLVLCNGMPRSGSTLQYNLVCNLVEAAGVGTARGGVEHTDAVVPDLRRVTSSSTMSVYKTHVMLPGIMPWIARGDGGVLLCYIYRDIRDVAVSLLEKHGPGDERVLTLLGDALRVYGELRVARDSPHVLWQRYEDVIADRGAAARETADFLGLDTPATILDQIAEDSSIDSARRVMGNVRRLVEAKVGSAEPDEARRIRRGMRDGSYRASDPMTMIHWNHISRHGGVPGVWRTELPAPLLTSIVERYADWFVDAGYVDLASAEAHEGART